MPFEGDFSTTELELDFIHSHTVTRTYIHTFTYYHTHTHIHTYYYTQQTHTYILLHTTDSAFRSGLFHDRARTGFHTFTYHYTHIHTHIHSYIYILSHTYIHTYILLHTTDSAFRSGLFHDRARTGFHTFTYHYTHIHTHIHSYIYILSHTYIHTYYYTQQIVPFDVDFSTTELELDFTDTRTALTKLVSSGSIFTWSSENALWKLARAPPKVCMHACMPACICV